MESLKKRILALDFGSKTVGVAITDPLLITAQELETIVREKPSALRATLRRIVEIVEQYDVGQIVLGLPLNMNDEEGERVEATKDFAEQLRKRISVPIDFIDERLTTIEADEILAEQGVPKSERKKVIDQVAAAIMLREYLDNMSK